MSVTKVTLPMKEDQQQLNELRAQLLATGMMVTFVAMCIVNLLVRLLIRRTAALQLPSS